eukprot:TRINITY_DN7022_c0_g1_i1.p1 TRINITY_DN7022_c0_g1~~TRINITY_DN7022_c0_g1_i1.p1  ORF type:complete len:417 (-),score=160.57 TRINITY_DN7022_c0_g1_i1:156-1406(-)
MSQIIKQVKEHFNGEEEDPSDFKDLSKEEEKESEESRKPTSNQIRFFEKIGNFRDIGLNFNSDSGTKRFKEGVLFRSATLDFASEEDLKNLIDKFHLKSIIDLRAENEIKSTEGLANAFPSAVLNKGMAISAIQSLMSNQSESDSKGERKRRIRTRRRIKSIKNEVENSKNHEHSTYYINFASNNYRRRFVWDPLSLSEKYQVAKLMATSHKADAIKLVGQVIINPQGLEGLYRGFIDYCGEEIVEAIQIMASPDSYPLLVHCTQGKDRTGIVCAMVLGLCGASEEMILKDYSRSEEGLREIKEDMIKEMASDGLGPQFTEAPKEIMKKTLDYVNEKYGGIEEYLRSHGMQERDKLNLLSHLLSELDEETEEKLREMSEDSGSNDSSTSEEDNEKGEKRGWRARREKKREERAKIQ